MTYEQCLAAMKKLAEDEKNWQSIKGRLPELYQAALAANADLNTVMKKNEEAQALHTRIMNDVGFTHDRLNKVQQELREWEPQLVEKKRLEQIRLAEVDAEYEAAKRRRDDMLADVERMKAKHFA